jgi:hypothetical protein
MSDSSLQATATRLITKKGRPVQLQRKYTASPADPAHPWTGPAVSTMTSDTYGVWIDPLKSRHDYQFAEKREFDGSLLVSGWDVMIPAAGLKFTPMQGDYLLDVQNAKTYKVVTVSPAQPGALGIMFTLQVED